MLIKLPVSELKSILPGLSRVVPKTSTTPALQGVRINRDEAGQITLTVTDQSTFASYRLEQCVLGETWDGLVPFEILQRTVKSCQPDEPESEEPIKKSINSSFETPQIPQSRRAVTLATAEHDATTPRSMAPLRIKTERLLLAVRVSQRQHRRRPRPQ